jgi:hypothetical protein
MARGDQQVSIGMLQNERRGANVGQGRDESSRRQEDAGWNALQRKQPAAAQWHGVHPLVSGPSIDAAVRVEDSG